MLKSLSINNIVLIEKSKIDFEKGLCILSGETGSGKSILLDALGLAIGFRSNLRLIGNYNSKAQVVAEFDISQNKNCQNILAENELLDEENKNSLIIRRSISSDSSSKVFVNDTAIGVNLLAQIGQSLVEIHGQHDQGGLLNAGAHLEILDNFADNENLLKDLQKIYKNLRACENEIAAIEEKKEKILREKDYLNHTIAELENAAVKPDEEDELLAKKEQISSKEKITKFLSELKTQLTQANSAAAIAQKTLTRNQNIIDNFLPTKTAQFENINDLLDKNNIDLESAISSCEEVLKQVNSFDENLEEIEERLFFLRALARKHNKKISQLEIVIEDAKENLKAISDIEESAFELEKTLKKLTKEYHEIAKKISSKRAEAAKILAKKVEEELKFLKMDGVKFLVKLIDNEKAIAPNGYEGARFQAAINNNNFDDIAKIASGGELSRFMLALKVSLLGVKSIPTIIFDEIDSGIGGGTADAVGKRLKILAQDLQVLVVTHQAQIAAKANLHFKISKTTNDKVRTSVEKLDSQGSKQEIARMLSGEKITEAGIAAAQSLIEG